MNTSRWRYLSKSFSMRWGLQAMASSLLLSPLDATTSGEQGGSLLGGRPRSTRELRFEGAQTWELRRGRARPRSSMQRSSDQGSRLGSSDGGGGRERHEGHERQQRPGEARRGRGGACGERNEQAGGGTESEWGGILGSCRPGRASGLTGGFPEEVCMTNSAWLGCEVRFELHNRAWLRGYIRIRWVQFNWADPTYQIRKSGVRWDFLGARHGETKSEKKNTLSAKKSLVTSPLLCRNNGRLACWWWLPSLSP
jgi:hypothetical protein